MQRSEKENELRACIGVIEAAIWLERRKQERIKAREEAEKRRREMWNKYSLGSTYATVWNR